MGVGKRQTERKASALDTLRKTRKRAGLAWAWAALFTLLVLLGGCLAGCAGGYGDYGPEQPAAGASQETYGAGGGDRDAAKVSREEAGTSGESDEESGQDRLLEDGSYSSKEEVALYLHLYGHLPDNYITKREARDLGWDSKRGNLWEVAPGTSIGGSHFGNYEGQLPEKKGRRYYECDIDYDGGHRGAKRIIYSDDGLIYYTEDHYETFEKLYE